MRHEIIAEEKQGYQIALYIKEDIVCDIALDHPDFPYSVGYIIQAKHKKRDQALFVDFYEDIKTGNMLLVRFKKDQGIPQNPLTYLSITKPATSQSKIAEAKLLDETPKQPLMRQSAYERLESLYNGAQTTLEAQIIDHRGYWEDIESLACTEIALPNNKGRLLFETGETLSAIDIDQAGARGNPLTINMAAVKTLVRHIALRKMSGIIMIDFIRMQNKGDNQKIEDALKSAFAKKPALQGAGLHGFTKTGLYEITIPKHQTPLHMIIRDFFDVFA